MKPNLKNFSGALALEYKVRLSVKPKSKAAVIKLNVKLPYQSEPLTIDEIIVKEFRTYKENLKDALNQASILWDLDLIKTPELVLTETLPKTA
jgi:hypothetical protein